MKNTLLSLCFILFVATAFAQFKVEDSLHYKNQLEKIREVYKIPTAFGYLKSVTEVEGEIREDIRVFYKLPNGEVEDISIYGRIVPGYLVGQGFYQKQKNYSTFINLYQPYGEMIYHNGVAIAVIFKPKKNLQEYLIKILKPLTPTGGKLSENCYIKDYKVTFEIWNTNVREKVLNRIAQELSDNNFSEGEKIEFSNS